MSSQPAAALPTVRVHAPSPSHSVVSLAMAPPREPPTVTTYHIYQTGAMGLNFAMHTIPDSELATLCPAGTIFSSPGCSLTRWYRRLRHGGGIREVILDDPHSDPRKPAYFVHTPRICCHTPPQTLRFGGKGDSVVCLLESSSFWRRWTLDFVVPPEEPSAAAKRRKKLGERRRQQHQPHTVPNESEKEARVDSGFAEHGGGRVDSGFEQHGDELALVGTKETTETVKEKRKKQEKGGGKDGEDGEDGEDGDGGAVGAGVSLNAPGVVDPRGVIASRYPLRPFGLLGETGREYIRQQRRRHGSAASPIDNGVSALAAAERGAEPPEHLTPLGPQLVLSWNGWLTREYVFRYAHIDFKWKGTGTVRDERRFWGPWRRYNHLKLVAALPLVPPSEPESSVTSSLKHHCLGHHGCPSGALETGGKGQGEGERVVHVTLAKYTNLWGDRKLGRLAVFEAGLEHCFPDPQDAVARDRLRHIVIATAFCMLQGEREKRETLRKVAEILIGAGENGGTA